MSARAAACLALLAVACEGRRVGVRADPAPSASPTASEQLSEHAHLAKSSPALVAFLDARLAVLQRARVTADLDPAFGEPRLVERRDAAFGVIHVHERGFVEPVNCETDALIFDGQVAEWSLVCGSGRGWEELRQRFLRAYPILRAEGLGVAATGSRPPVVALATARRASKLGPAAHVVVPASLRADYDRLVSSASLVAGDRCGFAASETEGHAAVRHLEEAHRVDLLRNVLRGPNAEARVLAARVLRAALAPDPADLATIAALSSAPHFVMTCSGCVHTPVQIADALR